MNIRFGILALALCSQLAFAASANLPAGWREPTAAELSAEDDHWRDKDPAKYQSAKGDFKGDGRQGEAVLLASTAGKEFALFFHSANGNWQRLNKKPFVNMQSLGVAVLAPGKYATACGKGYWPCKAGEPKELDLAHAVFLCFEEGSSTSVYVWSGAHRRFEQVWLSD